MTIAAPEISPSTESLSDDELMTALNAGEVDVGVEELKRRYRVRVQRSIENVVRDRHLAEDLTQEVFARVVFKCELYRSGSNFKAWLFGIARNQALTAIRARRNTPLPMGSLDRSPHDEAYNSMLEQLCGAYEDLSTQEREFMDLLSGAVDRLPGRYQDVFRLCVQEGRPYQEAATRLGIPTGTVASRIMRARQRLYHQLSHHVGRVRRLPACLQ